MTVRKFFIRFLRFRKKIFRFCLFRMMIRFRNYLILHFFLYRMILAHLIRISVIGFVQVFRMMIDPSGSAQLFLIWVILALDFFQKIVLALHLFRLSFRFIVLIRKDSDQRTVPPLLLLLPRALPATALQAQRHLPGGHPSEVAWG